MNYLQFEFEIKNNEQSEKLIALLSDADFEGFEEGEALNAFILADKFNEPVFYEILNKFPTVTFSKSIIENINWNQQWENSFSAIIIDDFVAIRAKFHEPIHSVMHEIVITPKMSFGTGHHATTYLMLNAIRNYDFKSKKVLDFGTGTCVLAILAEKSGAKSIVAIDNDEWSITNAEENILENNCLNISLIQTDTVPQNEVFDIVMANINLNVILSALSSIVSVSVPGAFIFLSGFLNTDEGEIMGALNNIGLQYISTTRRDEWILIIAKRPVLR